MLLPFGGRGRFGDDMIEVEGIVRPSRYFWASVSKRATWLSTNNCNFPTFAVDGYPLPTRLPRP